VVKISAPKASRVNPMEEEDREENKEKGE